MFVNIIEVLILKNIRSLLSTSERSAIQSRENETIVPLSSAYSRKVPYNIQ